ncbi:e3 ubiquitin-protein ligase [Anaeramoeba flamelloides]|uniref:E3 ubiquitin-protein ligase n=1 Tax=Anaeramoeba flamelloides TaxID=1746091 RepID=A0AAV8AG99_9EUKA|nr:e3 ubiquitin-protein ligase [Anaeramoeba flamelloides]
MNLKKRTKKQKIKEINMIDPFEMLMDIITSHKDYPREPKIKTKQNNHKKQNHKKHRRYITKKPRVMKLTDKNNEQLKINRNIQRDQNHNQQQQPRRRTHRQQQRQQQQQQQQQHKRQRQRPQRGGRRGEINNPRTKPKVNRAIKPKLKRQPIYKDIFQNENHKPAMKQAIKNPNIQSQDQNQQIKQKEKEKQLDKPKLIEIINKKIPDIAQDHIPKINKKENEEKQQIKKKNVQIPIEKTDKDEEKEEEDVNLILKEEEKENVNVKEEGKVKEEEEKESKVKLILNEMENDKVNEKEEEKQNGKEKEKDKGKGLPKINHNQNNLDLKRTQNKNINTKRKRSVRDINWYEYKKPGKNGYIDQAQKVLENDFLEFPVTVIKKVLNKNQNRYAPTHKELINAQATFDMKKREKKKINEKKFTPRLKYEIRFIKRKLREAKEMEKQQEIRKKKEKKADNNKKQDGNGNSKKPITLIDCTCCFTPVPFEKMVSCKAGHLICENCLHNIVKFSIGKKKINITCPSTLEKCNEGYSKDMIHKAVPPKLWDLYERLVQESELDAANIKNLYKCPFCDYAAIIEDPNIKILECLNPKCFKDTCLKCKDVAHKGKTCEEAKLEKHSDLRVYIEEEMTKALLRRCNKCGQQYYKTEGCNKIVCSHCKEIMCYLCGKSINREKYNHFSDKKGGCKLWTKVKEDKRRVRKAYQKARKRVQKEMRKRKLKEKNKKNVKTKHLVFEEKKKNNRKNHLYEKKKRKGNGNRETRYKNRRKKTRNSTHGRTHKNENNIKRRHHNAKRKRRK